MIACVFVCGWLFVCLRVYLFMLSGYVVLVVCFVCLIVRVCVGLFEYVYVGLFCVLCVCVVLRVSVCVCLCVCLCV